MPDRKPTADEELGMKWWNALTEAQRGEWLRRANSATPADAWAAYRHSQTADQP
jgi:hypothetical protein